MPAIQDIPDALFEETITRAVQEVFSTMLGKPAVPVPLDACVAADTLSLDLPHVVGTVGFIGAINGLMYLYLDADFAQQCAGNLLGLAPHEISSLDDEAVNDAIGELTNMTVGTFKNQLSDRGFGCRLTIPSILRGSRFRIEPISSATRRIYRFDIGGRALTADLLMQPGE
ncbi:MAG: chemotaxis protein CheX [Opitutaceae bacterium]|jgi:chemotaxis protein CheX